jgi:transcriptional regulator NrdR family protein
MQCGQNTQVFNSRPQKRFNKIWRRRRCTNCKFTFTTVEDALYGELWLVETNGKHLQPFSRDKLLISLYSSLGHRKTAIGDAGALTDTIIKKLVPLANNGKLKSSDIVKSTEVALNRFDKLASAYYRAHHQLII